MDFENMDVEAFRLVVKRKIKFLLWMFIASGCGAGAILVPILGGVVTEDAWKLLLLYLLFLLSALSLASLFVMLWVKVSSWVYIWGAKLHQKYK